MTRVAVDELFAVIPSTVLSHPELDAQDVRVYGVLALAGYAGDNVSIAEIGRRSGGVSEATIRRSLKRLAAPAVGAVEVEFNDRAAGGQRVNRYVVKASPVTDRPATGDRAGGSTGGTPSLVREVDPRTAPTEQAGNVTTERKPRRRDPLFDALQVEAEGIPMDMAVGKTEGARIGTAVAEIRAAGMGLHHVRRAIRNWPSHFEGATVTAKAIAAHIGKLQRPGPNARFREDAQPPSASDVFREEDRT